MYQNSEKKVRKAGAAGAVENMKKVREGVAKQSFGREFGTSSGVRFGWQFKVEYWQVFWASILEIDM